MSLVERAVVQLKDVKAAQRGAEGAIRSGTSGQSEPGPVVEIDRAALRSQGFCIPKPGKPERLPQELRAIKRRLLRRLKFYQTKGKSAGSNRNASSVKNLVLVTSTSPAEGKSFTAINLALSLSLEDEIKVLLVDADVPRPRVSQYLGLPVSSGLTDRLADSSLSVPGLVQTVAGTTLKVFSDGTRKDLPRDIFAKREMADTIRDLSTQYSDHLIIFDAPPVLATPEAVFLAQSMHEILFVVRAGKTPEPAVVAALDEILEFNEKVSLILNYTLVPGKHSHYGSYSEYYHDARARNEKNDG